jgi:hypothetical protein
MRCGRVPHLIVILANPQGESESNVGAIFWIRQTISIVIPFYPSTGFPHVPNEPRLRLGAIIPILDPTPSSSKDDKSIYLSLKEPLSRLLQPPDCET